MLFGRRTVDDGGCAGRRLPAVVWLAPVPLPEEVPDPRPSGPAARRWPRRSSALTVVENVLLMVRSNVQLHHREGGARAPRDAAPVDPPRAASRATPGRKGGRASRHASMYGAGGSTLISPAGNSWRNYLFDALEQLVLSRRCPTVLRVAGSADAFTFWLELCAPRRDRCGHGCSSTLRSRRPSPTPNTVRGAARILGWICGRKGKSSAPSHRRRHPGASRWYVRNRYGAGLGARPPCGRCCSTLGWLDDPAPILPDPGTTDWGRRHLRRWSTATASPRRTVRCLIEYLTHRSRGDGPLQPAQHVPVVVSTGSGPTSPGTTRS